MPQAEIKITYEDGRVEEITGFLSTINCHRPALEVTYNREDMWRRYVAGPATYDLTVET